MTLAATPSPPAAASFAEEKGTATGTASEVHGDSNNAEARQRVVRNNGSDDVDDEQFWQDQLKSTRADIADMQRLGRKQEFTRHFRAVSMFSFTAIVQATWEFVIISMYQGLLDGGRPGMSWSMIWVFVGFLPIVMSLAEMASMAPTSGGQYHWVSEFAPESLQKPLSYFAGWMATLSWQAGNASGPFATGTLIQALISLNNPDYEAHNWQGTLLVIANVLLVYVTNVYGTRFIPAVQNALMVVHVFLFFAVVIPIWVLAPRASTQDVFINFTNGGGWPTMALAVMDTDLQGSDAAAHMAEEVKARSVPIAMVGSYIINGILGIVVVITICFALPDLDAALEADYPHLVAFEGAMSTGWVLTLNALILLVIFASNVSYLASTARETFAFGRDNGLPFAKWVSRVHPTRHVPQNALLVSSVISVALSLIYIGSDVAFYAIISLNIVALMATYSMSIGCVLWRRVVQPETLPPARWSLGKAGIPVNVAGLVFGTWAFFWAFWPESTPVDASGFNWAVVMFGAVALFSVALYIVQGRRQYVGPVVLVEGRAVMLSSLGRVGGPGIGTEIVPKR